MWNWQHFITLYMFKFLRLTLLNYSYIKIFSAMLISIWEVSFNHLFQIGGKSLRWRVKAIVSNVFYALTGMNIRRFYQIL